MKRRGFIKKSCSVCFMTMTAGIVQSLQGCLATSVYKTNAVSRKVAVPLALLAEGKYKIISVNGEPYDFAVIRQNDDTYRVFRMRCTHAENELVYSGAGFHCPLHGSVFNRDGKVSKGPASVDLEALKSETINSDLVFYLG